MATWARERQQERARRAFAWTALLATGVLVAWNLAALLSLGALGPAGAPWIAACIGVAPAIGVLALVAGFLLGRDAERRGGLGRRAG